MMWLIFGLGAILFAFLGLFYKRSPKGTHWFIFTSLSLTSLTLLAFYVDAARRVDVEDWSALMDILPTTSKALIVCTLASILINAYVLKQIEHEKR